MLKSKRKQPEMGDAIEGDDHLDFNTIEFHHSSKNKYQKLD